MYRHLHSGPSLYRLCIGIRGRECADYVLMITLGEHVQVKIRMQMPIHSLYRLSLSLSSLGTVPIVVFGRVKWCNNHWRYLLTSTSLA